MTEPTAGAAFLDTTSAARRVAVTGIGLVTAYGAGCGINAQGFREGTIAFRPVTLFDVSRQRAKAAAEIELPAALPASRLSPRQERRLDRASRMLLLAGLEAWQQAGWASGEDLPMVLGTTSGGMQQGEAYYRHAVQHPRSNHGQPTRSIQYQPQRQALDLAEALGISGPITLVANACASGANAIGLGWELVRNGRVERVLTGGYDALSHLVFAGFDSLQALSPTVCRPFDARRDGLGLGEGAAVLLLEPLETAHARGADLLGELCGYGASTDVHHLTQPHPDGAAAMQAMAASCNQAGIEPWQVDYVNAHGTGTPLNDSSESLAICSFFGKRALELPVSSTKAGIGHLLGAAGAVEAVVCLMALRGQWLPPTRTIQEPDPLCGFALVREPAETSLEYALSNSFGFGGANASLVFRRCA